MGFGKLADSYCDMTASPNSGLGQGSRASPPGFVALSSLIINAYCRMGHGAKILSSYTSCLFHLSTVMYIVDTNLLHWPPYLGTEPDKLIEHVQWATMDYGRLVQASGGLLKEKKCLVYFLDYKAVRGHFQMKSLQDLPQPRPYIMEEGRVYGTYSYSPT
jgi:hypothetical protein